MTNHPDVAKITDSYSALLVALKTHGIVLDRAHLLDSDRMQLTLPARREHVQKLAELGLSQRKIAALLGVSRGAVESDLAYFKPDSGLKEATRDEKEAATRDKNAALKLVQPAPVVKRYGTIVIDPPWEMEKIKRDTRPNQVGLLDYPTMTRDELAGFGTTLEPMADEDCHLFCWTTHKHLPTSLSLVAAWGFKYTLLMTWHKPGGYQPHGLPQFNSEFVVYARRGNPGFRETTAFNTCFQGERREHSRKPDEFYNMIRRVTDEGRIDVFSREPREGFDQYGNETRKFADAV